MATPSQAHRSTPGTRTDDRPPRPALRPEGTGRPILLGAAVLILATLVVYLPAIRSGYIWDDDAYVHQNPTLTAPNALSLIWLKPEASPQYYPLVFTTFLIERGLWGTHAMGYHVTNVILHALSALIFWRLLRKLTVPGAFLAAVIFALHPVQVESVAWITERKNVLSGLFYLLSASLFLPTIDSSGSPPRRRFLLYGAALLAFACALFSKTTAATLPAALLMITWWKRGRFSRDVLLATIPFLALGIGLGLHTAWLEKHHVGAEGYEWGLAFPQRLLIAGRAVLFYLQKLILPTDLMFMYPRWNVEAAPAESVPYLLASVGLLAALVLARRRIGTGALVGFLFFVGTLFPALGFFDVYPFRYSWVADHFQYLATLGPIAVVAAGIDRLIAKLTGSRGSDRSTGPGEGGRRILQARAAAGVIIAIVLGALAWHQQKDYRDAETLWTRTLEKNPRAWIAHVNLGTMAVDRSDYDQALARFRRAMEIRPTEYNAYFNAGSVLNQLRRYDEAVPLLRRSIELFPRHPYAQYALGLAYLRTNQPRRSIEPFAAAIELRADWTDPLNALAWVLVAYPDSTFTDPHQGLQYAQRATDLAGSSDPYTLDTLAAALAAGGRFEDALVVLDQARSLLEARGDQATLQTIETMRVLFAARQVYRESP